MTLWHKMPGLLRGWLYLVGHMEPKIIRPLRVLVACESSGAVRDAFCALGHDAMSCDLLPTSAPGPHYQGNVLDVLNDGWDLLIAHPPCTYLAVSGMHWTVRGFRPVEKTTEAIAFAEALWCAPVTRIAIENPVGVLSTQSKLGEPRQVIQPHQFGDDASKGTCLWLKGLPPLMHTHIEDDLFAAPPPPARIVEGRKRYSNQTDSGQNKLPPSKDRWQQRSKTYAGIAQAMAEQWGGNVRGSA